MTEKVQEPPRRHHGRRRRRSMLAAPPKGAEDADDGAASRGERESPQADVPRVQGRASAPAARRSVLRHRPEPREGRRWGTRRRGASRRARRAAGRARSIRSTSTRRTLLPLRWGVRQGTATVVIDFTGTTVKGAVKMGAQEMPIDVDARGSRLRGRLVARDARRRAPARAGIRDDAPRVRFPDAEDALDVAQGRRHGERHRARRDVRVLQGRDQADRRRIGRDRGFT